MLRIIRILSLAAVLLLGVTLVTAQTEDITFTDWTGEVFNLQGLAPEGWGEAAPGVFLRQAAAADPTALAMQSFTGLTAEAIIQSLLPQMGISALPESIGEYVTDAFTFELYLVEVSIPGMGTLKQDFAISDENGRVTIVWLPTVEADYDALHEGVFIPALEALALIEAESAEVTPESTEDSPPADPMEIAQAFVDHLVNGEFDAAETMLSRQVRAALPGGLAALYDEYIAPSGDILEVLPPRADPYPGTIVITLRQADTAFDLQITSGESGQVEGLFLRPSPTSYSRAEGDALPLDEALLTELDTFIEEAYQRFSVPGAAVIIVQGDEVVFSQGYGVKEVGTDDSVTPNTLFPVASVSKSINSTFLATLVSEGILSWDTPVTDIMPDFALSDPELTGQVTIRDLLGNSYGLQRSDFEWIDTRTTVAEMLASLAGQEFSTEPGAYFGYNNQMVSAGGYIGALANGADPDDLFNAYATMVQERVFTPIGMETATLDLETALANPDIATGHTPYLSDNRLHPLDFVDLTAVAPAGAVFASAEDMAKYLSTMLNEGIAPNGNQIAEAAALRETWTPQIELSVTNLELVLTPMSYPVHYGMGWFIEDFRGVQIIQHAGNLDYASASIHFMPDANIGIAILHNRLGASNFTYDVAYKLVELLYDLDPLADALFEEQNAETEANLTALVEHIILTIDPEEATDYLGDYSNGAVIELRNTDELWLTFGAREMQLVQISGAPGYFVNGGLLYGQQVTFRVNDDGSTSIILAGVQEIARSDGE